MQVQPLAISTELSGRILAPRTAEVRARVSGVVLKRVYREGSDVKQGDVLFLIDPAPFKADHDAARATLAKAEANLYQARLQEQRYRELVDDKAVSRQEYDNARAAFLQAGAVVAEAKAALERARLNLGYATVTAPISGRIGRALVTEGALVGQNETTPLATIQQLDPIHADVTQSTRELNTLRRAMRAGELQQVGEGQARATLIGTTARPIRCRASCCSQTSASTRAPTRSPCAASSPTRTSTCCRVAMCACAWTRPCNRRASACRSARSCATAPVCPRCWWSMSRRASANARWYWATPRAIAGSSPRGWPQASAW